MRNKIANRLRLVSFSVLFIISLLFVTLPSIKSVTTALHMGDSASNLVNISMWIVTVLSGALSLMCRKPVLQHEIYCRDHYFIDRLSEREALFAFLDSESADAGSLFFVKGGMCRGKTVLLQRFADDVNQSKGKNDFRKRYKKVREYSAYYIAIHQSCEDIVQEIGLQLHGDTTLNTYGKVSSFLKKASYRKKVVLLIDNISKAQSRIAIETAHALLYKNPSLKIILGITEDGAMPNSSTLTPPLFGEMHVNEMAKKYEIN